MFLEHKAVRVYILESTESKGRWQIDCSLNSAQSFAMGRNSGGKV
ncbi:hypothetical protein [Leptospira noguchii]|nr:hypothetical protein [Leptospira noguchii]